MQDEERSTQTTLRREEFPAWLALYIGLMIGTFIGYLLGHNLHG